MNKKITIAIDAMGGENSPDKIIKAIDLFEKENNSKKDLNRELFYLVNYLHPLHQLQ